MSHGIGSTSQMMERAKWPEKAAQDGYVVYTFDFCGGSQNGNSDMDFMDMTVMTEKSDLSAVMDFCEIKGLCGSGSSVPSWTEPGRTCQCADSGRPCG